MQTALEQGQGLAATINVTGACMLVDAITAANLDTATGGCTAGSGADTIILTAGSTHTLTSVNNTDFGPNGLPRVTSAITISGNGSTVQRSGRAPFFRLLEVDSGGNLTIQGLTLMGGVAAFSAPFNIGGGLLNFGILTLTNSTVSGNAAFTDTSDTGGIGGGIFSAFNSGPLTLTNSTVSGNVAFGAGGGVFNNGGPLTGTNSTISGNTADTGGGGVLNVGHTTLTNSAISGNTALFDGGGVGNLAALTLTNSTVSGNTALFFDGGGVFNRGSGTVTLNRTLVSGNIASTGPEIFGSATANNFNLFGFNSNAGVAGFAPGATDLVPSGTLSTILNPTLAANGGPTQTHALVSGSPALNAAGPGCPPPATDQRGVSRPQGAACDIGAFELSTTGTPVCGNGAVETGEQCEPTQGTCCTAQCQFATGGTSCRTSAGVCDVADSCTGSAAACPADVKSTAVCRSSAGVCDVAESCNGVGNTCPANGFAAAGTTCRGAAGVCDVAESCTGSAAACPANVVRPNGTVCTDDSNQCTTDVCSTGACTHPQKPNGTACEDGQFCTVTDQCTSGTCGGSARNCTNGQFCDGTESCNETTNACQSSGTPCPGSQTCDESGDQCVASGPDLVVTAISNPPGSVARKGKFPVTSTVRNQGTAPAGASKTRYYLSPDTVKSSGDKRLTGTGSVPALAPSAQSTKTVPKVGVPANTALGTYFLLACADDTKAVTESNEGNNCRASATQVTVGP